MGRRGAQCWGPQTTCLPREMGEELVGLAEATRG